MPAVQLPLDIHARPWTYTLAPVLRLLINGVEEQARRAEEPEIEAPKEEEPVVHTETFGICLVDESELEPDNTAVAPGLRFEHEQASAPATHAVCETLI